MYKNWVHAEGEDKPVIENIDNYLSAIENAKNELSDMKDLISAAHKERMDMECNNSDLLKSKLNDIEKQRQDIEILRAQTNEMHSKNCITSETLERQLAQLISDKNSLALEKVEQSTNIKEKEKSIDQKWHEIHLILNEINAKKIELDNRDKLNEEVLNKILDEKKDSQEVLSLSIARKKDYEGLMADANNKLEQASKIKLDAELSNKESVLRSESSNKALQEIMDIKSKVDADIESLNKQRELLKDLIIESKKSKFESNNANEIAQKNIVEANHKIAELNELKTAMAQQEK